MPYEHGFKDPAYFNRVFSKMSGASPNKFREDVDFHSRDTFLPELYQLLETHHMGQRSAGFYASKMHVSIRTLSKKVKDRLNITLGQLIRMELIKTAKSLLQADNNIKEIAFELGFAEANHFSSFFQTSHLHVSARISEANV